MMSWIDFFLPRVLENCRAGQLNTRTVHFQAFSDGNTVHHSRFAMSVFRECG